MIAVTTHAKRRLKERCGVHRNSAERIAERAFRKGISFNNASEIARRYISSIYLKHDKMNNNVRIYGDIVYIFENQTLITVFPMPNNIAHEMDTYASEIDMAAEQALKDYAEKKKESKAEKSNPAAFRSKKGKGKRPNMEAIKNDLILYFNERDVCVKKVSLLNDHIGIYIGVKCENADSIAAEYDIKKLSERYGFRIKLVQTL